MKKVKWDSLIERLDRPLPNMIMCSGFMLLIVLFSVFIGRRLDFELFEDVCVCWVIMALLCSPVSIVDEFFKQFRKYKEEKKHGS